MLSKFQIITANFTESTTANISEPPSQKLIIKQTKFFETRQDKSAQAYEDRLSIESHIISFKITRNIR